MNIKTKEIYSEVYQVLNCLGDEYINKLPSSLFDIIKEKRDINYNPQYTDEIPLDKQNIKKETMAVIALLHLNYWCENENERIELRQMLKNNENRYQQELRDKYNPDDIFEKQENLEEILTTETAMVEYKESLLKKIINKIKEIFHKQPL